MNFRESRRAGAVVLAAVLFVFSIAAFGASPASAAGKQRCSIKGTKGPDKLFGTKGRDVICGFGGDDRIWGRGGNDVIRGGKGDDVIRAGAGNDRLLGEPDNDRLYAGPGNDYLDGGKGRNHLYSGPGNNKCINQETDTRTPGCDDIAPVLEDLTLSSSQVDTSVGAQTVVVTVRVTDDLAGVKETPSLEATWGNTFQRRFADFHRVSGNELDGVYEGTVTLPRSAPKGDWDLHLTVVDNQSNHLYLNPQALDKAGFPSAIKQVGEGDQDGPDFKSFEIDRTTIDTSTAEQTVYFRARVTDVGTGIPTQPRFPPVEVILVNAADNGNQRQANNMTLVSGDHKDGIYEGSITFPIGSGPDVWEIRLGAIDDAGNVRLIAAAELATKGFPNKITITG